jgi:23S rRNA pseudouridine2604 synthase
LLVLTQDGRVARQLIGDDSTVEKEYLVRVEGAGWTPSAALPCSTTGWSLDGHTLQAGPGRLGSIEEQLRFRPQPKAASGRSGACANWWA